jgi:hypothetical protein
MTPEDKPLFLELGATNKQINAFVFALLEDTQIPSEDQHEFGARLIRLGEAVKRRSQQCVGRVIEGSMGAPAASHIMANGVLSATDAAGA